MSDKGTREARLNLDLTLRCPTCGARADMCFAHGDEWKKRTPSNPKPVHRMTGHELRASVNDFTRDDPPPYGSRESRRSVTGSLPGRVCVTDGAE